MNNRKKLNKSRLLEGLEDRRLMATFTVTNANDDGAGSLRQAIVSANAAVGADTINFLVPGNPASVLINPVTQLPDITSPVTIDGSTQPGFASSVDPIVRIRGFNPTNANGLVFKSGAAGSIVRGLFLSGFKRATLSDEAFGNGIVFDTGMIGGKIEQSVIGGPAGMQGSGIVLRGQNALVENNRLYLNRNGIRIEGPGATTNAVVSNLFEANGNFEAGIVITNGASNNTIGGSTSGSGNVFAANDKEGIRIETSDLALIPTGNKIQGNTFGINSAGAVGGNLHGVRILAGANTVIGGTGANEGNVFSHNVVAHVELVGANTTNTTIQGNYFGMKRDGTILPNAMTDFAIDVRDGATATIGGTAAGARNYITGGDLGAVGIKVENNSTAVIKNNVIGMNATDAAGALNIGVSILNSGSSQVGGSGANEGNYFANANKMVAVNEGATAVPILGNRFGLTLGGASAGGITGTGVSVSNGSATIGGANAGERNYFTGNSLGGSKGIELSDGATAPIRGNHFGFNSAGVATGNLATGINLYDAGPGIDIGGLAAGEGNSFANTTTGISLNGVSGVEVSGNQFGMNLAGTAVAGNGGSTAVYFVGLGGQTIIRNNIIAGMTSAGINGDGNGVVIQGNRIGLTADGLSPLNHPGSGIVVTGNAQVGGINAGEGNVMGRINGSAIDLSDGSGAIVQGNKIGVNINGTAVISVNRGIKVSSSYDNAQIGGTVAGAGNLIASAAIGVEILGGGGTKIEGNTFGGIGLNNSTNIRLVDTLNATIGGSTAASANNILGGSKGIVVENTSSNVTIRRNTIRATTAIDLGNDGLTANDAGDADTGANTKQNFPVLLSADSSSGTNTLISGVLNTSPGTPLILDYYASDASGIATTWLFSQTVVSDAGGAAIINATLPFVAGNKFISATATHLLNAPFGNTSELSPAVQVSGPVDTTGPSVTGGQFHFETSQAVKLFFSEDLNAGSIAASDLQMKNTTTNISYTPSSFAYDVANKAITFSFSTLLPDGNYTYTLPAGTVSDVTGNVSNATYNNTTFVLAGDTDRNRSVNFDDLLRLAQNYGGTGKTFSQGDSNYDGKVDFDDLLTLAQRYGTSLFSASPIRLSSAHSRSERVELLS